MVGKDHAKCLLVYRLFFAGLVAAAIAMQFVHGLRQAAFSPLNFFSFFTIESNVLALGVFLVSAYFAIRQRKPRVLDWLRGAATLYMTVTGVVYVLLLSGLDVQLTFPWVNVVLHYLMPAAVLIDWLVDRPGRRLAFGKALWWLGFPLLYVAYSLARGPSANWYPYPFLDPRQHGYVRVFLVSVVLAACMMGAIWLLTLVSRWPRRAKG